MKGKINIAIILLQLSSRIVLKWRSCLISWCFVSALDCGAADHGLNSHPGQNICVISRNGFLCLIVVCIKYLSRNISRLLTKVLCLESGGRV